MDLNHDFNGDNEFLVTGPKERLQRVKAVIMAFGDMGYTDPALPNVQYAIGDYTDSAGKQALEGALKEILVTSMVVRPEEIVNVSVISATGANSFTARLDFTFGTVEVKNPVISGA